MRVLVIVAHPAVGNSFNHRLAQAAVRKVEQNGHDVRLVDLYEIGFDPVGGPRDFTELLDSECFRYQEEQRHAATVRDFETFEPKLLEQIELLKWADRLIFQFPMYWFTVPAILKGWMDRVLAYYFAYGGRHGLKRKRVLYSFTTGGPGYSKSQLDGFYIGFETAFKMCKIRHIDSYYCLGVNYLRFEGKRAIRPDEEQKRRWIDGLVDKIDLFLPAEQQ